jgi:hypothetical protein
VALNSFFLGKSREFSAGGLVGDFLCLGGFVAGKWPVLEVDAISEEEAESMLSISVICSYESHDFVA